MRLRRFERARLLAAALAALLLGSACGGSGAAPAKNLLFISIDTLRADALGSYGNQRGASPQLDAFAQRSVLFEQAWSHSPKTAPSHMSMLTGLPPRAHGVGNLNTAGASVLGEEVPTMAEILAARGFRTAAVTSGGNVKSALGFDRGFEIYQDQGRPLAQNLPVAERWLGERDADERWFLFFHTYEVHDPYFPAAQDIARFADADYAGDIVGERAELNARIAAGQDLAPNATGHDHLLINYWRRADLEDPVDLRHLHDLYLAGLAGADRELGAFLRRLEQRGLLDETLVVITSDHGEEFGEHGRTLHDQLWREVLHVPLIVRLPDDRGAGARIQADVRHMDLLPSVLQLLDVPHPLGSLPGESWAAWVDEPEAARPRPAFAEHRSRREHDLDLWTLRTDGWLLHAGREGTSLHQLDEDPAEVEPLEDEAQRARLEELRLHELGRLQELAARFATGEGVVVDAETRAELEALGYFGEGEDG